MYVSQREDTLKKMLSYVYPMEPLLYACIFASSVTFVGGFVFISYFKQRWNFVKSANDEISVSTAVWYIVSALVQQGKQKSFLSIFVLLFQIFN